MSAKKPDPIVLFSDSALTLTEQDAFDLERKLGVIRDAILNENTKTPFTIMVTGGWGSGKTSAMSWLEESLKAKSSKSGKSEVKVDTCWFYPWKYQKQEDVWRGLIAEVILAITHAQNLDLNHRWQTALRFSAYLGKLILAPIVATKAKLGDPKAGVTESDLAAFAKEVASASDEFFDPEAAYLNDFEETLEQWVFSYYPEGGSRRLVVFIDDLDRCNPDIALQVLEALKLYLDIPNLVFVVGVDRTVIDQIVTKSYCDMVGEKAMEGSFKDKAAKYLDKMFQVEINIEPTDHEIRTFFAQRIEDSDAWKTVPDEIRETLKILLTDNHGGISDRTPRSLVRQFNRLLVAAQRDSGEGSLSRAQAMQREMIDLICHEKGLGDDLPQRSQRGREFFRKWSEIIRANLTEIQAGRLASYFPAGDSDSSLPGTNDEEGPTMEGGGGFSTPQETRKKPSVDLNHLGPLRTYVKYSSLLTSAPLARLLELPYAVAMEEVKGDLDTVRAWIAAKRGVQPDRISDEEILKSTELDISGMPIPDLSPVSCLLNLRELYCYDSNVRDLAPLVGLKGLERLDCDSTEVSDLSPLSGLTGLKELYCSNTEVSDLSPLSALFNLRTLTCLSTKIKRPEVVKLQKALPNCEIVS